MPIDNKQVQYQAFPQVLPKHPHRTLYILLTTLLFVLVAGGIVMYQINQANTVVESPPVAVKQSDPVVEGLKVLNSRVNKNDRQAEIIQGLKILSEKHKQLIKNKNK